MKIKQISLFAENKQGHIAAPVRLMAKQGIDVRALVLAETQQYGILRMIVSDWQKAAAILGDAGFTVKVTEVLAVEVGDHPGGLAHVLATLDACAINIEYMYAFPRFRADSAILLFRFTDPDAAIACLKAAGVNVLASDEILK
ncbi:MAG: amino acid-binding protein [Verrucomicrobiia bacterium]|jgi:hypothetical protein